MNEQLIIYLWSISENASIAFGVSSIVLGIGSICLTIGAFSNEISKWWLCTWIVAFFFLFMTIFIPSKQDLALIWAYPYLKNGVSQVAQNKELNKLPDNIMSLTNTYLEKQIKEIKENKEGE